MGNEALLIRAIRAIRGSISWVPMNQHGTSFVSVFPHSSARHSPAILNFYGETADWEFSRA
jgi:hypothetical protein